MLKVSKMVEYSILLLTTLAKLDKDDKLSAREISLNYNIPLPTVSKILKQLSKGGIVKSIQGSKGGYCLAKDAGKVTLKSLMEIFDGKTHIVECSAETEKDVCNFSLSCPAKKVMLNLDNEINNLFEKVTLEKLTH